MNNIFYPKTKEDLEKLIEFNMKIYQDENLKEFIKWVEWFEKIKSRIMIILNEDEYLNISFKENSKFSLEVWKIGETYNYISYNLASNTNNEFNIDTTVVENS